MFCFVVEFFLPIINYVETGLSFIQVDRTSTFFFHQKNVYFNFKPYAKICSTKGLEKEAI